MEILFGLACVAFVLLIGYHCMKESDESKRRKAYAEERVQRMQADRARQAAAEYERQRAPRSAPVTTGRTKSDTSGNMGYLRGSHDVKRRDNSFDFDVDTYTAPTYSSSHSTSSYSSGSCSSSSSSSSDSSSSSSSSSGGCD